MTLALVPPPIAPLGTTIPIDRDTKKPACKWAHLRAGESVFIRPDQDTGLLTGERSGVVVVDYDPRHDPDRTSWEMLVKLGILETRCVQTRRDGLHGYYVHPGHRCKNSAGKLAQGVDVRADGGYVKAPPSPGYEVVHDVAPLPAPEWLLSVCRVPEPTVKARAETAQGPASRELVERARAALFNASGELSRATENGNPLLARLAYTLGGYSRAIPIEVIESTLSRAISHWDELPRHLDTLARSLDAGSDEPHEEEAPAPASSTATEHAFGFLTSEKMCEEQGEPDWVIRDLGICPGRPCAIVGTGSAGKSLGSLLLAACVAIGHPFLDRFPCSPARVVWLDYEMGQRATLRRLRRLCRGHDLDFEAVIPATLDLHLPKDRTERAWLRNRAGEGRFGRSALFRRLAPTIASRN